MWQGHWSVHLRLSSKVSYCFRTWWTTILLPGWKKRGNIKWQRHKTHWFHIMGKTSVKLGRLHKEFRRQIRPWYCGAILMAYTFPVMNNIWKYNSRSPNDFHSLWVRMNQALPKTYDLPRDCTLPINMLIKIAGYKNILDLDSLVKYQRGYMEVKQVFSVISITQTTPF